MKKHTILFLLLSFFLNISAQDFPVIWGSKIGVDYFSSSDSYVKTVNTSAWGDAYLVSSNSLANEDTGYFTYKYEGVDDQKVIGFSGVQNPTKISDIIYGIYFNKSQHFLIVDGKQSSLGLTIAEGSQIQVLTSNSSKFEVLINDELINENTQSYVVNLKLAGLLKSSNSSFSGIEVSFQTGANYFEINAIDLNENFFLSFDYDGESYSCKGGESCIFPLSNSTSKEKIYLNISNPEFESEERLGIEIGGDRIFKDVYYSNQDEHYFEEVKFDYTTKRLFLFTDENSTVKGIERKLSLNLQNGMSFNPNETLLGVKDLEEFEGDFLFKIYDL